MRSAPVQKLRIVLSEITTFNYDWGNVFVTFFEIWTICTEHQILGIWKEIFIRTMISSLHGCWTWILLRTLLFLSFSISLHWQPSSTVQHSDYFLIGILEVSTSYPKNFKVLWISRMILRLLYSCPMIFLVVDSVNKQVIVFSHLSTLCNLAWASNGWVNICRTLCMHSILKKRAVECILEFHIRSIYKCSAAGELHS